MRCLALDTTTDISSIAVADETGVLAQYDFAHRMDLSRRLMPNIVGLLKDLGMEMKDVEAIGVSLGPGSFTGLRIGVTTAKTLAQALGVPIAGVVTLDLLAHQFVYLPDAVVCPIVKVRKGEVYWAFFRTRGGSLERISEYAAGPVEDVIHAARVVCPHPDPLPLRGCTGEGDRPAASGDRIPSPVRESGGGNQEFPSPVRESANGTGEGQGEGHPRTGEGTSPQSKIQNPKSKIFFCGDALKESLGALREALGDLVLPAPDWLAYPKASILARLALEKIKAGEAADPLALVPFYIRRSAPEMRMERKENGQRRRDDDLP